MAYLSLPNLLTLGTVNHAARLNHWRQTVRDPSLDFEVPVVVNLQVSFHNTSDVSPPILLDASQYQVFSLLEQVVNGIPQRYRFKVTYEDNTYSNTIQMQAGNTAATAATYREFLGECYEAGRIRQMEMKAKETSRRDWEEKNIKGRVVEGIPWDGRGRVVIADIWAKVEVFY